MASLFGVTCGLMAFAAMIVRGLLAGNPAEVILLRSLGGLFGFLIVGSIAGWIASLVLQDKVEDAPEKAHAPADARTARSA